MNASTSKRIVVYVDGFNLFYGLRDSKMRRFYWLDLERFAQSFLREPGSVISEVKYFTAPVKGDELKHERQSRYLTALETCSKVKVFKGCYLQEPFFCSNCQNRRPVWKEKQTDTNIATELVADAFLNSWDIAYLVSADSDLVPPLTAIKTHFPKKSVIVAFPPARRSGDLRSVFGSSFWVNESMLKSSQFPDTVLCGERTVTRPTDWE